MTLVVFDIPIVADFTFLHNPISHIWVISAPRRAKRPNEAERHLTTCPFCSGGAAEAQEVYRISKSEILNKLSEDGKQTTEDRTQMTEDREQKDGSQKSQSSVFRDSSSVVRHLSSDWSVLVVYNTFPFSPIHEVVIHSPDHLASFAELPLEHVDAIFQAYQHRYNEHSHKGQVIIFNNHGISAGESLPHPHTQIAVVPFKVRIDAPELRSVVPQTGELREETESFVLMTPDVSQWPDEVWIAPKEKGKTFGQITDVQRRELAYLVKQLVYIYDHRYNKDFPFNFYIYPGEHWYLRLIPRIKSIGGFELATGIFVNTQSPEETMSFIREHLKEPNLEKILKDQKAEYHRSV